MAGAATGGLLCARMGKGPMIASAAFGGIILAMIEGAGLLMNRFTATWMMSQQQQIGMTPFKVFEMKILFYFHFFNS